MFNTTMLLIEKFVSKEKQKVLAKTILDSQDIHESSWNVNESKYEKDYFQSAKEAVDMNNIDEFYANVICSWNTYCWNDIQSVAEIFLKNNS